MPQLNVTVSRVAYPNATAAPEAWYILITDQGACKGNMSWRPQDQEELLLDGEWTTYKGEKEFKFKQATIHIPEDPRAQLHYVCCRTNGLGNAAEQMIWDKVGENWKEIQEGEVTRLKGKIYQNFLLQTESLKGKSAQAKVVAALMDTGATMNMAESAWSTWEEETMGVVTANCYRMADLPNYGFRDIDNKIRQFYGITNEDKRRIRAAVVYTIRRLTDRGDTVIGWSLLYAECVKLLGGYAELVNDCTGELFGEGTLKSFPEFGGVSLAADWVAENTIWNYINDIGDPDA